jgi:ribosomal-protein-alanine N-acetyltransferase
MTVIRPMRWWDIAAVQALEEQLFPVDRWSVEQFWAELAQPTRRYLVACEEDTITGYAGVFVLAPDADVQTIAVAPTAQGSGLGSRLLERLLDIAADAGCHQLMLEVRSDNAPAIALYDRFGFERISSRTDYYGPSVDALIMRLRPLRSTP